MGDLFCMETRSGCLIPVLSGLHVEALCFAHSFQPENLLSHLAAVGDMGLPSEGLRSLEHGLPSRCNTRSRGDGGLVGTTYVLE